jgi:hypothetical protein
VSYLGPPFGLVLLLSINLATPAALAQSDDKIVQNFSLIFDVAEKICYIAAQPTGQVSSNNTQADILPLLEDLSRKLTDTGVAGTRNLSSEQYLRVLRDQLAASVNNNVQCRVEVAKSLMSSLSQKSSAQRSFLVTRESGWRGGGYSPSQWCNDLISILRVCPGTSSGITEFSEHEAD